MKNLEYLMSLRLEALPSGQRGDDGQFWLIRCLPALLAEVTLKTPAAQARRLAGADDYTIAEVWPWPTHDAAPIAHAFAKMPEAVRLLVQVHRVLGIIRVSDQAAALNQLGPAVKTFLLALEGGPDRAA